MARKRIAARKGWLRGWGQDVGFAARNLRRRRLFSVGASILLGLGVAACATVFSFLHAILVAPLPFPQPDRLVRIEGVRDELRPGVGPYRNLTLQDVDAVTGVDGIEAAAGMMPVGKYPLTGAGRAEMISGAPVAPGFFRTLGVLPRLGRPLEVADGQQGAERVVILGHGIWLQRFGGDPDVLGRPIMLNNERHVIVGVMPPGFGFPAGAELWLPLQHNAFVDRFPVTVAIARKGPGMDDDRLEESVSALLAARRESAARQGAAGARVTPLHARMVEEVRSALLFLGIAALVVLLVVSSNLGGLLAARASARSREMAIRRSLGAGPERVRRLLTLESLYIGLAGGLFGIVLTAVVLRAVVTTSPRDLPFRDAVGLTPAVVICSIGLALFASLVSAILSLRALRGAASRGAVGLQGTMRGSARVAGASLGVTFQVALATALLLGAGLLLRSFWNAVQVDPGVRVDNVLTAYVRLPPERYEGREVEFFEQALSRLRRFAMVESATYSLFSPLQGAIPAGAAEVQGDQDALMAGVLPVEPGYFRVMGIPLLQGRSFQDSDDEDAPPVAVVSRKVAAQMEGDPAIGQPIHWGGADYRVVGVVADVRQEGLLDEQTALLYVPFRQQLDRGSAALILRTTGAPMAMAESVRTVIAGIDRDAPVDDIRTLSAALSTSLAQPRFYAVMVGAFGGLTLVLAVAGLYAAILLMVHRRIFEFGLRAALGARPRDNLFLVLGRGMATSSVGALTGLGVGLYLGEAARGLLYQIEPTDPLTVAAAGGLMFLASLAAVITPALIAAKVDPMRALQSE